MSYFLAFLAFCALITLHEAGHFAAAKAVGMRVEKFSLFFGQMFLKKKIGETVYGIGWLPLGGYVKITGMSEVELAGIDFISTDEAEDVQRRAYYNQPVWKRVVVIAAGPAVNLVLAFLIGWVLVMGGNHYQTNSHGQIAAKGVGVGKVLSGSAAQGQLKAGDKLVSIDGKHASWAQIGKQIAAHRCAAGAKVNGCRSVRPVTLVVKRHGMPVTVRIHPRYDAKAGKMLVGFTPVFYAATAGNGAVYSAGRSVSWLWGASTATVSHVVQIFKPKYRRQLQGVAGAYYLTAKRISTSPSEGFATVALISLSLAIINLFPFLPLDGGHIFWALVEAIRRKRVPVVVMERASMVGIALVLILFVIGMNNSIHLFTTGRS